MTHAMAAMAVSNRVVTTSLLFAGQMTTNRTPASAAPMREPGKSAYVDKDAETHCSPQ